MVTMHRNQQRGSGEDFYVFTVGDKSQLHHVFEREEGYVVGFEWCGNITSEVMHLALGGCHLAPRLPLLEWSGRMLYSKDVQMPWPSWSYLPKDNVATATTSNTSNTSNTLKPLKNAWDMLWRRALNPPGTVVSGGVPTWMRKEQREIISKRFDEVVRDVYVEEAKEGTEFYDKHKEWLKLALRRHPNLYRHAYACDVMTAAVLGHIGVEAMWTTEGSGMDDYSGMDLSECNWLTLEDRVEQERSEYPGSGVTEVSGVADTEMRGGRPSVLSELKLKMTRGPMAVQVCVEDDYKEDERIPDVPRELRELEELKELAKLEELEEFELPDPRNRPKRPCKKDKKMFKRHMQRKRTMENEKNKTVEARTDVKNSQVKPQKRDVEERIQKKGNVEDVEEKPQKEGDFEDAKKKLQREIAKDVEKKSQEGDAKEKLQQEDFKEKLQRGIAKDVEKKLQRGIAKDVEKKLQQGDTEEKPYKFEEKPSSSVVSVSDSLTQTQNLGKAWNLDNAVFLHTNLEGCKFPEARMRGARLCDANLKQAFLKNSDLANADLHQADLTQACLENCNLQRARLVACDLIGTSLVGANLKGACLDHSTVSFDSLRNAVWDETTTFRNVTFLQANLSGLDFTGCDMSQAWFKQCMLRDTQMRGVSMRLAQMAVVDAAGVNLRGADLQGTKAVHVRFGISKTLEELRQHKKENTLLGFADVSAADLRGSSLQRCQFCGTSMGGVDLSYATLTHTSLQGADLTEVNLTGAVLSTCMFQDADLTACIMRDAVLDGEFSADTVCAPASLKTTKSVSISYVM